jgi:hypothetical protein
VDTQPLLLGFLLALAAACTLFSCSLYNRDFPQAGGPFDPKMDYVVQVDDYGAFWDPEVPNRLLRVIARTCRRRTSSSSCSCTGGITTRRTTTTTRATSPRRCASCAKRWWTTRTAGRASIDSRGGT